MTAIQGLPCPNCKTLQARVEELELVEKRMAFPWANEIAALKAKVEEANRVGLETAAVLLSTAEHRNRLLAQLQDARGEIERLQVRLNRAGLFRELCASQDKLTLAIEALKKSKCGNGYYPDCFSVIAERGKHSPFVKYDEINPCARCEALSKIEGSGS